VKTLLRILILSSVVLIQYTAMFSQWTGGTIPSWTQVDTLKTEHILSITVAPSGFIFIGTKDHGLWRSTDDGATWVQKLGPPAVYEIWSIVIDRAGTIYAGTHFVGVFRSTDNGDTWNQVISSGNIDYLSIAVTESSTVLTADAASSAPILRSVDTCKTWTPTWGPTYVTALATNAVFNPVTCTSYAGSSYGDVYYSTDDGASWTWTNAGRLGNGGPVRSFVVTSISGVFAGVSSGGVFVSGDGGATWAPRNTDLSTIFSGYNHYINWLGNNYASTTQPFLLLGTYKGVYWSDNSGGGWNSAGLDSMDVLSVANKLSGNVIAGTDGYGLWYTGDPPTGIEGPSASPVPAGYSLSQNDPNPFNPSTIITYALPASSVVSLKVYDVLGREISTLVNRRESAGVHIARFDGSNLPSGTYFYRLEAGTYHNTRKLVLLK
jgi:hypothetical protein